MGLTFKYGAASGQQFHCDSKLWLTADRLRLVPDGDPEAAYLFCVPGQAIPLGEAERFGLIRREPDPVMAELYPDSLLESPEPEAPDDDGSVVESEAPRRGPGRPRKTL